MDTMNHMLENLTNSGAKFCACVKLCVHMMCVPKCGVQRQERG